MVGILDTYLFLMKAIIYKYQIETLVQQIQEIEIPYAAEFLKIGIQGSKIVAWYLIPKGDQEVYAIAKTKRKLMAVWTGKEFDHDPVGNWYLDTVTTENGLVWHIFDVTDRE